MRLASVQSIDRGTLLRRSFDSLTVRLLNSFWDLIQLADNLVNFSIASLKGGYEIANFLASLVRLGVGRKSILECVACL